MSNKAKKVDALIKAAKSKREITLSKATKALYELQSTNQVITFAAVAKQANISVAWLYRQPNIRKQIEQSRAKSLTLLTIYKKSENTLLSHLKLGLKNLNTRTKNCESNWKLYMVSYICRVKVTYEV